MCKYPGLYVIGLTGGIASGKSTVSAILRDLGAVIIDADLLSRDATSKGSLGLAKIAEAFGEEVLSPDGSLDRKALGQVVFRNKEALSLLNSIVHPLVVKRTIDLLEDMSREAVKTGRKTLVVLDAPLLLEVGAETLVDEVWVVSLDLKTQVARLIEREGYTEEEALCRIRSQMPLEEKKKRADKIIDNSGSREETRRKLNLLWDEVKRKCGC